MRTPMRFLLLIVLLGVPVLAQERIALTTPIAQPSITGYTPNVLVLRVNPPQISGIIVNTASGQELRFEYPCANNCAAGNTPAKVTAMITALNTANLSTRSLWRRVFDRLVADFPEQFPGGASVP